MTTGRPSVTQALEQVAAWRESQVAENQTKIQEVDSELEKLKTTLANLQQQLGSLEQVRAQLAEVDLSEALTARSYEAVFSALTSQGSAIAERAVAATAADAAMRNAVFEDLAKGELAATVEEFRQFKETVEPTLVALPESYRAAITNHHKGVSEKIRNRLAERLEGPAQLSDDWLELDVVIGIDEPDGNPEVLICVLPIPDVALTEWSDRETDLLTLIGARVAQGIYEATKSTGPQGAQVICGGHQGMLAMEVDLEGAGSTFPKVLLDTLSIVLKAAPELAAAKVRVVPRRVDFDFLLPPETDEEDV